MYDAWKDRNTLEILSEVAGVDLVPVMDYEIGHINLMGETLEQQVQEPRVFFEQTADQTGEESGQTHIGERKAHRRLAYG